MSLGQDKGVLLKGRDTPSTGSDRGARSEVSGEMTPMSLATGVDKLDAIQTLAKGGKGSPAHRPGVNLIQPNPKSELSPQQRDEIRGRLEVVHYYAALQAKEQGLNVEVPDRSKLSEAGRAQLDKIESMRQPNKDKLTLAEKLNYSATEAHGDMQSMRTAGLLDSTEFIQGVCTIESCLRVEQGTSKIHLSHLEILKKSINQLKAPPSAPTGGAMSLGIKSVETDLIESTRREVAKSI